MRHRPLCRSTNGPLPLPALRQRGAFNRRQRVVGVGRRVTFDAAADAMQIEVEGGELDVGCENLPDPPDKEDQRVFGRQTGAAPEIAAPQRMHVFLQEGEIELQDMI